ncbi:MAG: methionyl-tRNA formyltransferase [Planctomycetota bacterium]|nr:methionyl-tRNA formyltransferase [Planctomycetota bacterium]
MTDRPLKLVLMGTGPFAFPSFQQIARSHHTILAVVTKPPVENPSRDKAPPESPILTWARQADLPVFTPASINDTSAIQWLGQLEADLLIVCDYGQILSKEALATASLGGINLHGSLLPRHRGAAPVQWSILAGDSKAGISVIHMTTKLDAGPVMVQRETPIRPDESADGLEARLSQLGVEPTLLAIETLARGDAQAGIEQAPEQTTKAPRLKKSDGQLDFRYPIAWIDRQIRGLQPWPGVFGNLVFPQDKPAKDKSTTAQSVPSRSVRAVIHRAKPMAIDPAKIAELGWTPGQVLWSDSALEASLVIDHPKQWVAVVAQDGLLVLETVQMAGKLPMQAASFVSGYGKQTDLRFETPCDSHGLLDRMMALGAAFTGESTGQTTGESTGQSSSQ